MIKTIWVWDNEETFDKLVNDFEKEPQNSVFATHTHVNQIETMEGSKIQYTAVIFYKVRL
jgi:hypothetical protein